MVKHTLGSDAIAFGCIEVQQPIGTFYIGAVDARDLVAISFADVRRIENNDIESYLGIQRPLSKTRVGELKDYVRTVDATFPTGVLLATESADVFYDRQAHLMYMRRGANVAKIIDGQHRIAGFEEYQGERFDVNVTIFVDMELEDQANVFATINLKQTKVTKSLAYDLYEYASTRSPQKTAHNIAKLLNSREDSPFLRKIMILGTATGAEEESITQATFVDRLLNYISREKERLKDRDLLKRNLQPPRASKRDERVLIFRNMFLDNRDAEIARVVWNYFKAVDERWPSAWREVRRGNILNRTTGFGALMRFLRPAYLSVAEPGQVPAISAFRQIFNMIPISGESFSPEQYKPGTSGESALLREFLHHSGCDEV